MDNDEVREFMESTKRQKYFPNPEFCAALNLELVGCADPKCDKEGRL